MLLIGLYCAILDFKYLCSGGSMLFLIIIGFIIVNLLIRRFVIPKIYTGQPFEDGRAFNKPNWIEMIESAFWLLLSITQVYQVYAVGWNIEVIMSLIFVLIFGVLWLSRSMDIYNFQHSEIRLTPNQITFRSDTEEWTTLQNITAVYFTSVRTERFTLSDMAKDFAMGVQRDGEDDVIIKIQTLRCDRCIVEWSKKFYTVVKAPEPSEKDTVSTTATTITETSNSNVASDDPPAEQSQTT